MRGLAVNLVMWTDRVSRSGQDGVTIARNGFGVITATASLVLIDPPALTPAQMEALEALGHPTHILLTCRDHDRETEALRERWGSRVLCHRLGVGRGELTADGTLRDGRRLFESIEPIHLPGFVHPEETAFVIHGPVTVLIIGDALAGAAGEGHADEAGLSLRAPQGLTDPAAARRALQRCLAKEPALLAFGHGAPVTDAAVQQLEQLLAQQGVWQAGVPAGDH